MGGHCGRANHADGVQHQDRQAGRHLVPIASRQAAHRPADEPFGHPHLPSAQAGRLSSSPSTGGVSLTRRVRWMAATTKRWMANRLRLGLTPSHPRGQVIDLVHFRSQILIKPEKKKEKKKKKKKKKKN